MHKLIAALIPGMLAFASVAAIAADADTAAYKMGKSAQLQHDLQLI